MFYSPLSRSKLRKRVTVVLRPILRHCLSALYPPVDGLRGIAETELDPYLKRALADLPWLMWLGMVGGALLFVVTPVITVFWPVPSFLLPASVLDRHAERVSSHPVYTVRNAMFLLKMLAGLHYAAVPEVRKHWALPPYAPDPDDWRTS